MQKGSVLVVDDEDFNLDIINEYLTEDGHSVTTFLDPLQAWSHLKQGETFHAILLDRMMPELDGLGLMRRIRTVNAYSNTPIVFQTARVDPSDIAEGIIEGAYYYITKPFTKEVLLAITQSAVNESFHRLQVEAELRLNRSSLCLLDLGRFKIKSLDEVRALSLFIASYIEEGERFAQAIAEILTNSVEHGNLEIGFDKKQACLIAGDWSNEIDLRLASDAYCQREVTVILKVGKDTLQVKVSDEGAGFDHKKYQELSPERSLSPNGRGVALAVRTLPNVQYRKSGTEVEFEAPLRADLIKTEKPEEVGNR